MAAPAVAVTFAETGFPAAGEVVQDAYRLEEGITYAQQTYTSSPA